MQEKQATDLNWVPKTIPANESRNIAGKETGTNEVLKYFETCIHWFVAAAMTWPRAAGTS
jgi:hypothetical protein